jgi:putative transposase
VAKTQTLSFPIRLPDAMQAEALRLLDASRPAINEIVQELWPGLDLFATERTGPAWKQVERHLLKKSGHGSRQERCEMEQAGRILRAQATRKQVFLVILPLFSVGLIRPAEGKGPAKKDYRLIKEKVRALRAESEDADAFMAMTNVIEQACNVFLQTGVWPTTYEDLQAVPVLTKGQLSFAGDDGMNAGQTYRARIDVAKWCDVATHQEHNQATLRLVLRAPDAAGNWTWGEWSEPIPLPETVFHFLDSGAQPQAPTLREISSDDGSRLAVLDLILQVPAKYVSALEQENRVLGWDWGIRSLITVSVLENRKATSRIVRAVARSFWIPEAWMGGRHACVAKLIASRAVGSAITSWSNKRSKHVRSSTSRSLLILLAGRSGSARTSSASRPVGRSMSDETANWRTWPPIC